MPAAGWNKRCALCFVLRTYNTSSGFAFYRLCSILPLYFASRFSARRHTTCMTHSVIIPTRNRPGELGRLFASLAEQTCPADEIIVVDASDDDASAEEVQEARAHAKGAVVYMRTDADVCAQRNAGIDSTRCDIITFLDDDVVLSPGYFDTMLMCFEQESRLAGAGGLVTNQVKRVGIELLFRHLFLLQTDRGRNRFRRSGFPDLGFAYTVDTEVEFLASTAASFRRASIGSIRFDAALLGGAVFGLHSGRAFSEDVVFSTILARTGTLKIFPSLSLAHYPSPVARANTYETQLLYIHAMRVVSAWRASGTLVRAARLWALLGSGLLCLIQTAAKRDGGYIKGYLAAIRKPVIRSCFPAV